MMIKMKDESDVQGSMGFFVLMKSSPGFLCAGISKPGGRVYSKKNLQHHKFKNW